MDLFEIIIYIVVFIIITIYSNFFTKKKKKEKYDTDTIEEYGNKSNKHHNNTPYKINTNRGNNPIFSGSTNKISYTRPLMLFFIFAIIAVILIAFFNGTFENIIDINEIIDEIIYKMDNY